MPWGWIDLGLGGHHPRQCIAQQRMGGQAGRRAGGQAGRRVGRHAGRRTDILFYSPGLVVKRTVRTCSRSKSAGNRKVTVRGTLCK